MDLYDTLVNQWQTFLDDQCFETGTCQQQTDVDDLYEKMVDDFCRTCVYQLSEEMGVNCFEICPTPGASRDCVLKQNPINHDRR